MSALVTAINRPTHLDTLRANAEAALAEARRRRMNLNEAADAYDAACSQYGYLKATYDLALAESEHAAAPHDTPTSSTEAGTATGGGNISQWNTLIPGVCDAEEGE